METSPSNNSPQQVRLSERDRIVDAIGKVPDQDPCVTIEGAVVQSGEEHLKLALELIGMVNYGELTRTKEGIWQLTSPEPNTT